MKNFFDPLTMEENINSSSKPEKLETIPIIPVPENAPEPKFNLKGWGNANEIYPYFTSNNEPIGYIARFEKEDNKTFRPFTYCKHKNGSKSWNMTYFPEPRPLYGCEQLKDRKKANILIVEGEKTANEARKLFPDYVVISWAGGANAIYKADWSVLCNRKIKLWPDNDEAGKQAMNNIAELLKEQDCEVSVVPLPPILPKGWDLADEIPKNKNIEFLRELLEKATNKTSSAIGKELTLPRPIPWEKPVTGEELLNELKEIFSKHLILPEHSENTLALWVLFTYCFEAFEHSPRLLIHSPEKRCGKTTLLMLLNFLCCKSIRVASLTASAMFRTIEAYSPTLLIDEADSFLKEKEELRGIINEGYTKGGGVIRTIETKKGHSVRFFSCFCPCAIAGIGKLSDTIMDRSILVTMRRKLLGESVSRLRGDKSEIFTPIKQKCARWAKDNQAILREIDPTIENHISDRAADNWRPLLIIAEIAGNKWVELAKSSMNILDNIGHANDESSVRVILLKDIKSIFEDANCHFLGSQELCVRLADIGDSPWSEWQQNRPITQRQLAIILRDFGIAPYQKRNGERNIRGYDKKQFEDAFTRYLPTSATTLQTTTHKDFNQNSNATNSLQDNTNILKNH